MATAIFLSHAQAVKIWDCPEFPPIYGGDLIEQELKFAMTKKKLVQEVMALLATKEVRFLTCLIYIALFAIHITFCALCHLCLHCMLSSLSQGAFLRLNTCNSDAKKCCLSVCLCLPQSSITIMKLLNTKKEWQGVRNLEQRCVAVCLIESQKQGVLLQPFTFFLLRFSAARYYRQALQDVIRYRQVHRLDRRVGPEGDDIRAGFSNGITSA